MAMDRVRGSRILLGLLLAGMMRRAWFCLWVFACLFVCFFPVGSGVGGVRFTGALAVWPRSAMDG